MRINFNKLEIHNFLSFEDEVFDFNDKLGMSLICGKNNDIPGSKNGAGKSAIWSALIFCLFGETQNGIKNENIKNRYSESKDVRVVVYFDIEDISYKLITNLNKSNQVSCLIYQIDGETEIDLTKSTLMETRKFLETEIFHCDLSIFLRTIYLSSDQTYNFFKLKKSEKKDFIEKLFDISVFGNMYTSIHKDILYIDKEISGQQNKLLILNKSDEEYLRCINDYNTTKDNKIKALIEDLEEYKNKYNSVKDNNITTNSELVNKFEVAINKINDNLSKLQTSSREITKKLQNVDFEISKLKSNKEQKEKVIEKHSELLSKLCDDCSIIFKNYYNLDVYINDISKIDEKTEKLHLETIELQKSKQETSTKIEALDGKLILAERKIKELTEAQLKIKSELISIESKIQFSETNLEKVKNEPNPYINLYENNKQKIETESNTLNKISEKYNYLKFAENIVSQETIRKFIIKDLIGLLNNKIKVYLSKVGAKYTVIFDEDMNFEFITDGGTCEYGNFSAGERVRIMIATCFAFRDFMAIRNNLSSNILILDEFIDGNIDSVAIEGILSILKDFTNMYNQNVYIISHREEIDNSIFDNIIQVVKTNNVSHIKYTI